MAQAISTQSVFRLENPDNHGAFQCGARHACACRRERNPGGEEVSDAEWVRAWLDTCLMDLVQVLRPMLPGESELRPQC